MPHVKMRENHLNDGILYYFEKQVFANIQDNEVFLKILFF